MRIQDLAFSTGGKKARIKAIDMELTLAITGASGTIYAHRTLQLLAASGVVEKINLIMSSTAATVAQVEMGVNLKDPDITRLNEWLGLPVDSHIIRYWRLDNFAAKPSSGSNKQAGMIIVPCSMGTLGSIASGAGTNLIHRAAAEHRRKAPGNPPPQHLAIGVQHHTLNIEIIQQSVLRAVLKAR